MTFFTVLFQMLALLVMIGAGVIVGRKGMWDDKACSMTSKTIVAIFNPMLIISSAIGAVGQISLSVLGSVALVAAGMFLTFIIVGMALSPLFEKDALQRKLFQLMFIFSNLGFIGVPVVSCVLGAEYVIYVTMFLLVYNVVFYTYGVALMDGSFSLRSMRSMVSFGNFASVASILILVFSLHLPDFLVTSITYLGNVASPLALVTVGYTLSRSNLRQIFGDKRLYVFTFIKLLVLPLIALPILKHLPLSPEVVPVCLVMIGMPVGNMPLMLGTEKGLDCSICSSGIMMTTLLCVVSIPMLVSLL